MNKSKQPYTGCWILSVENIPMPLENMNIKLLTFNFNEV